MMTTLLLRDILLAILVGLSPEPCEDALYRQFDFWLGRWEVYDPEQRLVGKNEITAEEEGCVLIERWNGSRSSGMSINYVDPATSSWRQTWVASTGYIVELEGGLTDDAMVMEGSLTRSDGASTPMRGRWTPLDDGRVRQEFWIADSTGAWKTWFDGYYLRADN